MNSSGAVSPAARAIARIVAVTMAFEAVGRITPSTVRQRATPSASAASRSARGTRENASTLARAISGTWTIDRATMPAIADCCQWSTISAAMKTPITIVGRPAINSSAVWSARARRGLANSDRYRPVITPIGSAIAVAPSASSTVPTSAGPIPPPTPS